MKRRSFLQTSALVGLAAAFPAGALAQAASGSDQHAGAGKAASPAKPLTPPAHGTIPVAFVLSEGAVMIDFAGPWEVFEDAAIPGRDSLFNLYTVAENTQPVRISGGMRVVPDYSVENAPPPKVIVLPAQQGKSPAVVDWIRRSSKSTDVTMSVCTGAFLLAKTGLLSGKSATTHHSAYGTLAMRYPDIRVVRGARFVEDGNIASAGGLSSGIDLALRVVERYFGRDVARDTAYQMEYQGLGWTDPGSNQVYAQLRKSTDEKPLCPVCNMDIDKATAPKAVYKGTTYYFCSGNCKEIFDEAPEKWV